MTDSKIKTEALLKKTEVVHKSLLKTKFQDENVLIEHPYLPQKVFALPQ